MQIEYALIAAFAEITGGKLYLMGGGWDTFHAAEVPIQLRIAIAAGVRIGWDETNVPIPLVVRIEDDDGQELVRIDGMMQVGRPPMLPAGSTQLSQMAANVPLNITSFGGLRARVTAGEGDAADVRTLPFRVLKRP